MNGKEKLMWTLIMIGGILLALVASIVINNYSHKNTELLLSDKYEYIQLGVYNNATKMCEFERYNCDAGFTFNATLGSCINNKKNDLNCKTGAQIDDNTEAICGNNMCYDEVTMMCIAYPNMYVCPINTDYNSKTDKCEYSKGKPECMYQHFIIP